MAHKSGRETAALFWEGWREAIEGGLDAARTALAAGDALEAERCAKAVSALAKAVRDAGEVAAQATTTEDDVEQIRAELRSRIARFVEADLSGAPPEVLERIGTGRDKE